MKKAFITGINGQDGSYLAELLLDKNYEVHGLVRSNIDSDITNIKQLIADPELKDQFIIHYGDLTETDNLESLLTRIQPDELYNLGAISQVSKSFLLPELTGNISGLAVTRMLNIIKKHQLKTKFYQASTSELFGKAPQAPQDELTRFYPASPYACAKAYAYWTTVNYRDSYKIFASNGILYNHESPRRGVAYVTKKITRTLARIKLGKENMLYLGNMESKRDWGYAKDYVQGMWLILQQEKPDDYILATGEAHTIREFVEKACEYFGFNLVWQGQGTNEKGIDQNTNKTIIAIDPQFYRPTDVNLTVGNNTKAKEKLGWEPQVKFNELVSLMCEHELKAESNN